MDYPVKVSEDVIILIRNKQTELIGKRHKNVMIKEIVDEAIKKGISQVD